MRFKEESRIIGNDYFNDDAFGFKEEIKSTLESYMAQGIDVSQSLNTIITDPTARAEFVGSIMESLVDSPALTQGSCTNSPFYSNYADRVNQLLENSLGQIARESVMTGYAPIVSYAPFFLKKQWVSCIYKDVVMTEVPTTPVINIAYEKRYLKAIVDGETKEYPIPEVNYDDDAMAEIMAASTGLSIDSSKDIDLPLNEVILTANYIPGIVLNPGVELTPNIAISQVTITDGTKEYEVPTNIRVDTSTHNFFKGGVKYDIIDENGVVTSTLKDELIGNVNFQTGKVTVMSTSTDENSKVTKIRLSGKLANRWNERSIDVERKVERIQEMMPESGPRLNCGVTVEESSDALALQNIDMIADNVDIMGRTLAEFEDYEIRSFLKNSFDAQEKSNVGPHGYEKLTVKGIFDTMPYDTYQGNMSTWQNDAREYFERVVNELKIKLHSENVAVIAVSHPSLIRFFKDNINWAFNEDTTLSGMKLNYNFGVMTSSSDRVHFITSQYAKSDDGISLVVIPLTKELITFKHYKYNVVIDRGYRNPLHTLIPNIMATQRTLTFEILPVQGNMEITGRELFSPTTLKRKTAEDTTNNPTEPVGP